MKRAVIIHGMPSKEGYYNANRESQSNSHWLPWLQQQLCVRDILAQTPEMPRPYAPDYIAWRREFERYIVDNETILVGHSCGGGFLLRWLSENTNIKVGKVVLVAPWLDPDREHGDLYQFELPRDLCERTAHGIDLLYSRSDDTAMLTTMRLVQGAVEGVRYYDFPAHQHFTFNDMRTVEFPELLEICLAT